MRNIAITALAAAAVLATVSTASADVQISMRSGRVTVLAKDATVRQILMEWARVGQTKIVNVERIPGSPLTLELRDVPEEQALKVLLRPIAGFMTAPRTGATPELSVFDRIIVMPSLAPTAAAATAGPPPISAPSFPQPVQQQQPQDEDQPTPGPPAGNRGPVFVFPQPQVTPGQSVPQFQPPPGAVQAQPQTSTPPRETMPPAVSFPGAPTAPTSTGVTVPGMVVPQPTPPPGQQPQQQ